MESRAEHTHSKNTQVTSPPPGDKPSLGGCWGLKVFQLKKQLGWLFLFVRSLNNSIMKFVENLLVSHNSNTISITSKKLDLSFIFEQFFYYFRHTRLRIKFDWLPKFQNFVASCSAILLVSAGLLDKKVSSTRCHPSHSSQRDGGRVSERWRFSPRFSVQIVWDDWKWIRRFD